VHTQQILEFETSTLDDASVTSVPNCSSSDSSDWEDVISQIDDNGDFVARFLREADWLIRRMGESECSSSAAVRLLERTCGLDFTPPHIFKIVSCCIVLIKLRGWPNRSIGECQEN
jgi:hypothetical protein